MLDSGAQPSVLDLNFVKEHNISFMRESSFVRGLAANPVQVCGTAEIQVDIGEGQIINQRFCIIVSPEPTVILGREFLEMFEVTTFDWHQHRVRLSPRWIPMIAKVRGGKIRSNASIIHALMSDWQIPFSEKSDWNIDPRLSNDEQRALSELLERYSDVFALNPKAPSGTPTAEHAIETGSEQPVKARGIRMSPKAEKEVFNQLDQMLENGIVRPSCSPWAARVVLVEKKDKSLRFAVDYRGLNDITRKDAYPIPDVRDMLDKLHGSAFDSRLDGASAYWSVPIREKDIPKTAFITPQGQYEFCVMPFGLTNAPATYQRAIDMVLREAPTSLAYVDDTLVYSQSFREHISTFRIHLNYIAKLKCNSEKKNASSRFRRSNLWGILFLQMDSVPYPR